MSGVTEVAECEAAQAQLQASPSPLPALLSTDHTTEPQPQPQPPSSSPQLHNHTNRTAVVSSQKDEALRVSQSYTVTTECMSEAVLPPSISAARTASLPCSLSPETDLGSTPASPPQLAACCSLSSSTSPPSHTTTQPHTAMTSTWPMHTHTGNTNSNSNDSGVSKGRTSTSLEEHHSPLPKAAGPHTTPVSPSSSRGSSHTRSAGGGGSARQLSSAVAAVYKRALVAANKHTTAGASSSSSSSALRRPLRATATSMNRNTTSTPSPKRARKAASSSSSLPVTAIAAVAAVAHDEMKETSRSSCSTSTSAHHTLSHTLVGATNEALSCAGQKITVDTEPHTSCTAEEHTRPTTTTTATPPPPPHSLLPRTSELLATSASDSARTSHSMTSVHTNISSSLASSRTSVVWYSLLLRFKGLLDRQEAVLERVSRLSTIQTAHTSEAGGPEEMAGWVADAGRDAQDGSSAQPQAFLAPSSSSWPISPSLLLPVHRHTSDDGPPSYCPVTSHDAACLFAAYNNNNNSCCPTHSPPAQHILAQRVLSEEETKAATRLLHAHHHTVITTSGTSEKEDKLRATHASLDQTEHNDMAEAERAAAELVTRESSEGVAAAAVVVRPVLDVKWNTHRKTSTSDAEPGAHEANTEARSSTHDVRDQKSPVMSERHTSSAHAQVECAGCGATSTAAEEEDVQAGNAVQGTPRADRGVRQQQEEENAEQMISLAHLNLSARKPPALQPVFDFADTALDTESSSVTLSLDVTQLENKVNTSTVHKKKAVRGSQTHGLVVSSGTHPQQQQQEQQQEPEREQSGEMIDFTSTTDTNNTNNTNSMREVQELRRLVLHHSGSQAHHKPEGRQESEDEMVMMMTNLTTEPGLASRTNSMTNLALQPCASYASNTTTLYGGVNGGSFASATISPLSQPMSSRNEFLNVSLLNSNMNSNVNSNMAGASGGNASGTPAMSRGFSSVYYATSPSSAATNRSMTPRQLISPAANASSHTASYTLRPPPLVFPSPVTGTHTSTTTTNNTTTTAIIGGSTMTSIAASTAAMNTAVSNSNTYSSNNAAMLLSGNVTPSTARTTSPAKASFLARVTFPGALPSHRTTTTTTTNTNTYAAASSNNNSSSGSTSHVLPLADATTTTTTTTSNTTNTTIAHTMGAASAAGTTPSTTTALPSISDFSPSSASPIALAMNRANGSNADEAAITLTSSSSSPSASSMEDEARPAHTEPADIVREDEEEEEDKRGRGQQSTEPTTQPHTISHTTSSSSAAAAADAFTRPKSWPAPPIPTMRRPPIVPHSTPFAPSSPHAAHSTTNNSNTTTTGTSIAANHAVHDEGVAYGKARVDEQVDACEERSEKAALEQDMSSPEYTDVKAYIAEEYTAAAMAEAELRRSDSWRAFELRHGQEHLPAAWLAPSPHVSAAAPGAAAAQLSQSANEEHEGRGQAVRVGPNVLLNETHSFHSDSEVYSSDYSGHSTSSSSSCEAEYVRGEAENRRKRARRYDELDDDDDGDEEEEDAEETEEEDEEDDDDRDVQHPHRAHYDYHHHRHHRASSSSPGAAAASCRGSNTNAASIASLSSAGSAVCTSLAAAYLSIHSHRYAPRRHGAGGRRVLASANSNNNNAGRSAAGLVRTEERDVQDENKLAAEHHTSLADADVVDAAAAAHERESKEVEEGVYSPEEQLTDKLADQTATVEEEDDTALSRAEHVAGRTTSVPDANTLWDLNSSLRELSRVEAQNIIALSSRPVRRPRRQRRVAGRRPHDWPAATALFSSLNKENTNSTSTTTTASNSNAMVHEEADEAAQRTTHSMTPSEAVVSVPELDKNTNATISTISSSTAPLCISDSPLPPPLSSSTHSQSHHRHDVHHGPLSAPDDIPRTDTHKNEKEEEEAEEERRNAAQASAPRSHPAAAAASSSFSSSPSMSRTPSVLSMSGHQANAKEGSAASLHRSTSTPYTSVVQTTASMSGADEAGQNMREAIQQKQIKQQRQSHNESKPHRHHEVMLSARSGEELRLSQECASVETMPRNTNTNITNTNTTKPNSRFRPELQDTVRTDSSTAAPAMALVSSSFTSSSLYTNAKDTQENTEHGAERDHAGSTPSGTRGQTRWTAVMNSTGTRTNAANKEEAEGDTDGKEEAEEEENAVNRCTPGSQVVQADGAGSAVLPEAAVLQNKSTTKDEEEEEEMSTVHSAAKEEIRQDDVLPSPAVEENNKNKEEGEGSPLPPPPLPSQTPTQTPTNQSTTLTTLLSTHEHTHHHHRHHTHSHHEHESEADAMREAHVHHHRTSSADVVNHGSLHEGSSASALTTGRSSFSSASSSRSSSALSSSSSTRSSGAQPRTHRTHRTPRFRFLHTPRGTSRPNALGNRSRSKAIASVVAAAVAQTQSRRVPNTHPASAANSHNASVTSSSMSKTLHKLSLNNNTSTTQPHLTLADFEDVAGLSAVLSRDLSVMEKSLHTFTEGQLAQAQHTQPYGFDGGQPSQSRRRRRRQLCEGLSGSNTPTAKGRRPTHRTAQPAASLTSLPRERHAVHARTATYTSVNTTSSTSKEAEVHTTQVAAHIQTNASSSVAAHARSHTTASWYKRRGKYSNTEGQPCPEQEGALHLYHHPPHRNHNNHHNNSSNSKTGQALAGTNAVSHVHPHRPGHRTRPDHAAAVTSEEKNKEGAQALPAQHFESVHTQPRTSAVSETSNAVHVMSGGNTQEGRTSTSELPSVVRELFMTHDQPFPPAPSVAALTSTAAPQASPPHTDGVEEEVEGANGEDDVVQTDERKQEREKEDEKRTGNKTAATSPERQDAPKEPSMGRGQSQRTATETLNTNTTTTTTTTTMNSNDNNSSSYTAVAVEEQSSRQTNAEQSATWRSESRRPLSSSSFLSPTAAAAAALPSQANTELSVNALPLAVPEVNEGTDSTKKDSVGKEEDEEDKVHHDRVVSQDSDDKVMMMAGMRRSGQNITNAMHHFASHPTRHGKAGTSEKPSTATTTATATAAAVVSTRRRYQQDMATGRLRSSRHGPGHTSMEARGKDSANTSNALLPLSHNTSSASSMSYVGNTNTNTATAITAAAVHAPREAHESKHHHLVSSQPYTAAGAVCDTVLLHRPANSTGNTAATTTAAGVTYATPLPQAHRTRTTTNVPAAEVGEGGESNHKCSPLRSVSASATENAAVKTSEGRTETTRQANARAHMTASPTTWRRAAAATNTNTSTNKHPLPMTASNTTLLHNYNHSHHNNNASGVAVRAATVLPQRNASPMRFPSALGGGRPGPGGSPLHTRRVAVRQGTGPALVHTGSSHLAKEEMGGEMSREGGAVKETGQVPRQHVEMPTATAGASAAGATRNVRPALL